jgi:thiol:disulfide interchange protein
MARMNRRRFVIASVAALTATGLPAATAAEHVPYSRNLYTQALASGEPFMLDFYADW